MTEKDQLKWYCLDCNDKPKPAVINEMLMDYMKNMNEKLYNINSPVNLVIYPPQIATVSKLTFFEYLCIPV